MVRAILVDDEPIALEVLKHKVAFYEDIEIVGSYTDPLEALKEVKIVQPDAVFLDIEMGGGINGLELANVFIKEVGSLEIVFITAYSQYAVDAFEINAIDYLLKPIQENRLSKAIQRLRKNLEESHGANLLHNSLTVKEFASFEVLDHSNNPITWRTQKSKELFAYLLSKKEMAVPKMLIIEDIFPNREVDKATTLLHTTIYQLRKSLERLGYPNAIIYFNDSYQLDVPIHSDVQELNRISESRRYGDRDIENILRIYKGDFLEEEGYCWAIELQQTYRERVFNILEKFVTEKLGRGLVTINVKACLDKLYAMDSFNENVAQMMIHYYGKQNKRLSLETFFNHYIKNLWIEMKLRPMKKTVDLYKKYMGDLPMDI